MIFRPIGLMGTYEFSLTRTIKWLTGKSSKKSDSKEGNA